MRKPRTSAQRKRMLKQRKIEIAPSPMYLEIMEILECGDLPDAELIDRFLTHDRIMAFVEGRIVDWVLWRSKVGRPLERRARDDNFSAALDLAGILATIQVYERWSKEQQQHGAYVATEEDGSRLARSHLNGV